MSTEIIRPKTAENIPAGRDGSGMTCPAEVIRA